MPGRASRPVLLYDGDCRLCRFAARAVARLDRGGEVLLLPLADDEASSLLADVPVDERLATWRLVTGDGSHFGYGRGVVELLRTMRTTRSAARVIGALPPRVLDRFYAFTARHRSRLGRVVPDGPAPRTYS